jgi:hypothetical protein
MAPAPLAVALLLALAAGGLSLLRCHALLAVLCPFVRPWKSPIELLGRLWDALVGWDQGRFWPIPAALLPACIPLARSLQQNSPPSLKGITVAALLFSIAFLQTYGQARNKRERQAAEDRFNDQSIAIRSIAAEVNIIAAGVGAIAVEAVKQAECLRDQTEQIGDIRDIISRE